jgi:NADPH:quinone reductase-like Zn-dependent oxidoreductase
MCIDKAAAGGMGSLLCQLGRKVGAFVIGTVSNLEKAKMARENGISFLLFRSKRDLLPVLILQIGIDVSFLGADEVIIYTQEDFVSKVKSLTNNQGEFDRPRYEML